MRETIIGDNVEITHERHSGYVDEIASMMRNRQVSELAIPMNEFIEQIIISSYKDEYKRLCNAVLVFISEDTVKHEAIEEGGSFMHTAGAGTAASDEAGAKVEAAGAAATVAPAPVSGSDTGPLGFNIINHLNEIKKKKSIIIPYKNKIVLEKYFTPPREQYDLYKLYISFYIINYQYI